MKNLLKYLFIIVALLNLIECREDSVITTTGQNELTETEHVSFLLFITDQDNKEIEGAILELGLSSTGYTSDKYGMIVIDDVNVPLTGLKASIELEGYYTQVKMLTGRSDSKNTQQIRLIKERPGIDIETGSQGEISGQVLITLPPSLIDESGNSYKGRVQVKSHYFDPESADELADAPGNMLALNTENEYQLLATLGMITVELSTFQGQSLSIPAGETATLSFPIASSQANFIPSEVPLWYFDETIGLWKREGEAIVENNRMVAEVAHFTTWNCDLPFDFKEGCIQFVNVDGDPLPNLSGSFYVQNTMFFGRGTVDADGFLCNKFPVNQEIKINVYLGDYFIESQIIGPFSSFEDLIVVTVSSTLGRITGNALDCDGRIATRGFGLLIFEGNETLRFQLKSDGSFSVNTIIEEQELILVNLEDGYSKTINISKGDLSSEVLLENEVLCEFNKLGIISGYVGLDSDENGRADSPLEGVKVEIRNVDFPTVHSIFTDSEGYYEFITVQGEYYVTLKDLNFSRQKTISCSDFSIDDSFDQGSFYGPANKIHCILEVNELDLDNNFIVINNGFGTITGNIMVDLDGDLIGDKTAEGIFVDYRLNPVMHGGGIESSNEYGNFIMSNIENGWGKLNLRFPLYHMNDLNGFLEVVSAKDETLDPDESNSSTNDSIPVKLVDGELDSDNNFIIRMQTSVIVCKILFDTSGVVDGNNSFGGREYSLYKRDAFGLPMGERLNTSVKYSTSGSGFFALGISDAGEYVLVLEEVRGYTIIRNEDQISDNNPINITGDPKYLPINIVGKEYDDGLRFILRKN